MTDPLFLVDALAPAGAEQELTGPEGRHAATVRRLRVGEAVLLGDGRGGRARAVVTDVGRDALTVRVGDVTRIPEPAPRVVLVQALVKGDRGELAVELATEAGVDGIVPWRAARCVARWEAGPRGDRGLARWRSAAREAAKQARRAWVPDVAEPVPTAGLVALLADRPALVLHEAADVTLPELAGSLPVDGDLVLVVGPEGGVADDELAALVGAGARTVRLGPEVLRASTAGAVALGALGVLTGRWRATVRA